MNNIASAVLKDIGEKHREYQKKFTKTFRQREKLKKNELDIH